MTTSATRYASGTAPWVSLETMPKVSNRTVGVMYHRPRDRLSRVFWVRLTAAPLGPGYCRWRADARTWRRARRRRAGGGALRSFGVVVCCRAPRPLESRVGVDAGGWTERRSSGRLTRRSVRGFGGHLMTVGLEWLLARPELHLRLVTGAAVGRRVTWAHSTDLDDPTPWLTGGELILTTGLRLDPSPSEQRAYVERLADAGVAGLGFGVGI